MHECLAEPKGNIATPFCCPENLKMPAETVGLESGASPQHQRDEIGETIHEKRSIKEERDNDGASNDASLLYTLAAAAASRSSTPSIAVKLEASTPSPQRDSPPSRDPTPPKIKREQQSPSPEYHHVIHTTKNHNNEDAEISTLKISDQMTSTHRAFVVQPQEEISSNSAAKHASQLHLMEEMMQRQRQLYEEYGHNNWMKMQRNDSNCLSKSKAKRYRWCVQKGQENDNGNDSLVSSTTTTSATDFNNKKKTPIKRPANNPMHDKLFGTVFTGASKFRCRDCGKSFSTLVDLTVHMSKTGHYRDQNLAEMKGCHDANSKFAKPKKRSMMESEEKESAEKVLKCLGCGHSFDSLQDLTVHMIKTKHYEDVPSLRLCSQKNDLHPSANGLSQVPNDDKQPSMASHRTSASMANDYSLPDMSDATKYQSSNHDQSILNFMGSGAMPPAFGGQPNFANVLSMAALRLLGGFPPYFMQMPFPNAMNGYDMANAAYAAAAARMFLSSPWMAQMPGLGAAGSMFPPFLNPHAPLPATMLSQTRQRSPVAGDVPTQLPSTHSATSSIRGINRSSPSETHTLNGNSRNGSDAHGSKSHILRCVQCGESFSSLQKMTDHMRETTHFPIPMTPPNDETNHRRGSRCSSSSDSVLRVSPHPKASPHRPAVPTSSPLEQLAKLACGKSLNGTDNIRPNRDIGGQIKSNGKPSSPALSRSPPNRQHSPSSNSLSGECYICPDSPRKAADSPVTGFDFIKSLESTIQSAISRVNQPTRSPTLEKQIQSSRNDQHRPQKSRKNHILNAFLPTTTRIHRKSLPDNCHGGHATSALTSGHEKSVVLKRPASDGEEYYHKGLSKKEDSNTQNSISGSPPLDLSRQTSDKKDVLQKNSTSSTSKLKANSLEETPKITTPNKNPLQCIKDDMQSLFDFNHRNAWEKKYPRARSPSNSPSAKRPRVEAKEASPPNGENLNGILTGEYPRGNVKSNPLKEMQKIVNATEMSMRETNGGLSKTRNGSTPQKRKIETDPHREDQAKSYKSSSVLSDLVRHDDDSPPVANPLAQMEHLVNLKIGQNTGLKKSSAAHARKQNLTKTYPPFPSEAATAPRNGTNPMSALMNLFTGTMGSMDRARDESVRNEKTRPKDALPNASVADSVLSNGAAESNNDPNDTNNLKEKMTEFFRSMFAQTQTFHDKRGEKSSRKPILPNKCKHGLEIARTASAFSRQTDMSDTALNSIQELKMQKLFAAHSVKNVKDINVPESESEALSVETGLPVSAIKRWLEDIKKQLMEKSQCSFVQISESNAVPTFRCTSCAGKSTQGLSARDFLHHLSTHISAKIISKSQKRRSSDEETPVPRKKDWEMLYRGAMHFKPLKAEDNSPTISLTARVTESPVEPSYAASPTMDIVSEQRKHVDVVEDSPIKVSG